MFKSTSKSNVGKVIFYTFEIAALIVGILLFVLAIYNAAVSESFMAFLSGFVSMVVNTLTIFALGKICDLLYSKREAKTAQEDTIDVK